jgi:hypothetical protein
MVPDLDREIRRSLLSWIFGDINAFKELSKRPMCRGQLKDFADHLGHYASYSLKNYSTYAQQHIRAKLMHGPEPLALLFDLIPKNSIDLDNGMRVRDENWEEWLQVCWGHDSDTLSMLTACTTVDSHYAFVEAMQNLPVIQSPVGAVNKKIELRDAHVHAGALCPPSIMWAHLMNTGMFIEEQGRNESRRYSPVESRKKELHLRGYLGLGRVLLATLIDLCDLADIPNDETFFKDNRAELMYNVSLLVKGEGTRDALTNLLLQELILADKSRVTISSIRGKLYNLSVIEFLQKERACVATLMWLAKEQRLASFIEELLLTYLRCKGYWFQVNSGLKTISQGQGLEYFRLDKELGREGTNLGDAAIAKAINFVYRSQNAPKLVDVRLTRVEKSYLSKTLDWLNKAFDSIAWNLVICLPRYNFNELDKVRSLSSSMLAFINSILDNEDYKDRLAGIDVVGLERDTSWRPYLSIMRQLREHINDRLGREKGFIVFHCGEDTIFPLKGICDIWYVLKKCPLKRGDRLAHGLDLLYPRRELMSGSFEMSLLQWEDLKDSMINLLSSMGEDPRRSNAERIWNKIEGDAPRSLTHINFSAELAQELASQIQIFVAETLKNEGIIFETCPTSNWRIKGLFPPTEHPISWWISDIKGEYLIGTDDPAVLPCTIETEYFAVARSIEHRSQT